MTQTNLEDKHLRAAVRIPVIAWKTLSANVASKIAAYPTCIKRRIVPRKRQARSTGPVLKPRLLKILLALTDQLQQELVVRLLLPEVKLHPKPHFHSKGVKDLGTSLLRCPTNLPIFRRTKMTSCFLFGAALPSPSMACSKIRVTKSDPG